MRDRPHETIEIVADDPAAARELAQLAESAGRRIETEDFCFRLVP